MLLNNTNQVLITNSLIESDRVIFTPSVVISESSQFQEMQIQALAALLAVALAPRSSAACDGFDQLRAALNANSNGLADSLTACVAPLLFAPVKWLPTDQAHEFCRQDACVRAVAQLKKLPLCMRYSSIPSGSDANTLAIAQQVMRDCGGA